MLLPKKTITEQLANKIIYSDFFCNITVVILATIVTLISSSSVSFANNYITPVVDGRFDPDEGYTENYNFSLEIEQKNIPGSNSEKSEAVTVDNGSLWFTQHPVNGDLFVNFTLPLSLVDNTYGQNSIGWGKDAALSGKNHNFEDLIESDSARFRIFDKEENKLIDFSLDYFPDNTKRGNMHFGSMASLLDWGTSLDYNFNSLGYELTEDSPATDNDYTENPDFPGWVFEVTYEFQIDGTLFEQNGPGDLTVPIIHASPNKIGQNKLSPELTVTIPEPSTICLFGLGCLTFLKRHKN